MTNKHVDRSDGPDDLDLLDRLATYRPDPSGLASEWNPVQARATVREAPAEHRLRWAPRVPVTSAALSAAAVAALVVGAVAAITLRSGSGPGGLPAAGDPYVPASVVATPRVGPGQFAYREQSVYAISADGTATQQQHGGIWAAPDGSLWFDGDISAGGCFHVNAPTSPGTGSPTQAWFDGLPTTGPELTPALRGQVSGSSSADEALFVAVGDMLRTTDLLATSALRAAAVNMLSTLSGITVHQAVTDYRGRAAVRLDWVNQALRPGTQESLFFDPSTFQLLEERSGASGAPTTYDGPSPAYSAQATDGPTIEQLTNPSSVTVTGTEKVVDSVPADVRSCPTH